MSPVQIIHIDYGTRGSAGFYLVQLLRAYQGPIPVEAYVHSEFPASKVPARVVRIFDRLSRYIPCRAGGQIYKFVDLYLCFAWLVLVLRIRSRRQRLIVFIQFFQSFHAYEWLFSQLSRYVTLVVTVHDAVELTHDYPAFIMSLRDRIIHYAHHLIVHGDDSMRQLAYLRKPMLQIPFPLMEDTAEGDLPAEDESESNTVRFLFIGHMRPEKGIDALVSAWRALAGEIAERASLTIAGTRNQNLDVDFKGLRNCRLIFEYLDDGMFMRLIRSCHYVVAPYRGGTNSGVISVATAMGKPCITTRIPLFANSPFFDARLSVEDPAELVSLIERVIQDHEISYGEYTEWIASRVSAYRSEFTSKLNSVYDAVVR